MLDARDHRAHVADEVAADQLAARQVDRDRQRHVADLLLPGDQVFGRLLHGEQAELHDQPAAFGDRDEVGRRDRAAARVLPAQQRLEAGDGAVLEPHDRLVGERELLALDRAAKVGFELQPVGADRAEGRPERLDAVAAEALGLVHGELGVLDHVLGGRLRRRPGDEADRGGQHDLALGEGDRRLDRLVDGVGDRRDARRVLLGQQHQRELVAGEARQRVAAASAAGAGGARW